MQCRDDVAEDACVGLAETGNDGGIPLFCRALDVLRIAGQLACVIQLVSIAQHQLMTLAHQPLPDQSGLHEQGTGASRAPVGRLRTFPTITS
jgi:hypothetical protein